MNDMITWFFVGFVTGFFSFSENSIAKNVRAFLSGKSGDKENNERS